MAFLATTDFTAGKIRGEFASKEYTNDPTLLEADLLKGDLCWAKLKKEYRVADADALVNPTTNVFIKEAMVKYTMWKMAVDRVGLTTGDMLENSTDPWTETAKAWKADYLESTEQLQQTDLLTDPDDEDNEDTGTIKQLNYGM